MTTMVDISYRASRSEDGAQRSDGRTFSSRRTDKISFARAKRDRPMCTRANVLSFRANSASPLVVRYDLERRRHFVFFFFDFSGNQSIRFTISPAFYWTFYTHRCRRSLRRRRLRPRPPLFRRRGDTSGRRRTTRSRRLCFVCSCSSPARA